MKHENKLVLFLLFASIASVCVGQIVFSGELKLGRVNTVGSTGVGYDASNEFNATDWPQGYAINLGNVATMSGSAMVLENASVQFVAPTCDWQLDVKATASSTAGYFGVAINGWSFLADLASGPSFSLGEYEYACTEAMPISTAFFRITSDAGFLTFEYSTDGTTYAELLPSGLESNTPSSEPTSGTLVALQSQESDASDTFSFDYVRFTAL